MIKPIKLLSFLSLVFLFNACSMQQGGGLKDMVAVVQMKDPVPGVCNLNYVLSIMPFEGNGQEEAVAPKTEAEIEEMLNSQVEFLKGKSDYNDEGMVGIIVNCKGKMVSCKIDNETQSPELDEQIVAVFNTLKEWKAGTIHGKAIDTMVLYSFKIKDGHISL
ncbi:hypothetical protein [Croceimicrobium hydrocarbonivorans]|uniref:TonB C-terminal domain-containing protein n=1 Tax=Croceimicrobium hydrocarbonivorans TaxID=2761580 RepID=A0A7H0VFA5_9FLAO|nr:hypothetical protein [Croceimicrobium hydrocarbonivorans]QNR24403.1 hypothetical protein H4K34_00770 [Croceimicrobium hydrocarbonivorans]